MSQAFGIKNLSVVGMLQNVLKGIFVLQILFSNVLQGQNQQRIDSLTQALSESDDSKVRWNLCKNLYKEYYRIDIDKAAYYNLRCIEEAKKNKNTRGIAEGLFNKSGVFRMKGHYDSALIIIQQAQDIYLNLPDSIAYADCQSEAGNLYLLKKDFKNSFVRMMEARKFYLAIGKTDNLAHLYNRLGLMYSTQKQYDSALVYHNLSLKINESNGFQLGSSVNLLNIGTVYESKSDYIKAIGFYQQSLIIKEQLGDKKGILKCLSNIGNAYNSLKDFAQSITYHQKALEISLEYKSQLDIARSCINLANDYQMDGKYNKAVQKADEGLRVARQINDLELLSEATRVLADSYRGQNNYTEAYRYQVLYKQFSDSIVIQNNLKALAEVQAQYESVKKENEITSLKIDKNKQDLKIQTFKARFNLFLGLFIALLALALFFYYRSLISKKLSSKLSEINEMKSRFFANLSHEFRTPLTLMLGPAEKLKQTAKPEDKPWLDLIIRNAQRLLFLDEQLLEFTKIDSGSQVIHLVEG